MRPPHDFMPEPQNRILIVDDDPKIRSLHRRLCEGFGYEAETAADGIEAMAKLVLDIDLVMLDGQMPMMDGFEVARQIRAIPAHAFLPIVMVTGLDSGTAHRRALEVGINDFVAKPINVDELRLRLHWLLELKSAHDRLQSRKETLERSVQKRTEALRLALEAVSESKRLVYDLHLDTIRRLTVASEFKDVDTGGHIGRIGRYAEVLAIAAGLSPGEVETIRHAAPMHDVGKIGIPDGVLLKPGKLDEDEWVVMRSHTTLGARLLSGSDSTVIQMGARIALSHHERWDGSGYPEGRDGEDIPFEARICSVVDYFDALTMDRPYRRALGVDRVLRMMRDESGRHFDPDLLDIFFTCLPKMVAVRGEEDEESQRYGDFGTEGAPES